MTFRLAISSLVHHLLQSVAAIFFIGASAALLALSAVMACQLFGSIENLMTQAQVPDILQMHAGKADEETIAQFAKECGMVEDWQLSPFLNLDNSDIKLGTHSLAASSQDNGLSAQPEKFDFLLDLDGKKPQVMDDEVWVPVAYQGLYSLRAGETMTIGSRKLKIAGFIRDAQMNAMMCSSKRFLVSRQTLEQFRNAGQEETLIEFMLKKDASPSAFRQLYEQAGLPGSGPFIDRSLILVMNALSDGTVIFLLLLVSAAVVAISVFCLRYILALQLEQERKETGTMKALGISRKAVRKIYLVRYLLLAIPALAIGMAAALVLSRPMMEQIYRLYGAAPANWALPAACLGAMLVSGGVLILSIRISLRSLDKQSPLDALRNIHEPAKSKPCLISGLVCMACTFLVLVPLFLTQTLASPSFVTNMGIGNAQLRLDCSTPEAAQKVESVLENDRQVRQWTMLRTYGEKVILADGSKISLPAETGNHQVFPLTLAKGYLPYRKGELALSLLAAKETGLECGDQIWLEGQPEPFTVCGIYSDITNGGKTAKAVSLKTDAKPIWQTAYAVLKEGTDVSRWAGSIHIEGTSVVSIQEYISQTYAQTLSQLKGTVILAGAIGIFIVGIVMFLALRLFIQQNSQTISLKKALGWTSRQLKKEWFVREGLWITGGIGIGILLAAGPGQWICALVLHNMGAAGFLFAISWPAAGLLLAMIAISALVCSWAALRAISQISPCECVRGKENSGKMEKRNIQKKRSQRSLKP